MVYILIIVAIVFLETKIKNYVDKNRKVGEKKPILGGRIVLKKHYNQGMMLNFMEEKKELVKKISAVILGIVLLCFVILLPKKNKGLQKFALSLVLGGGISNVSDRFIRGKVVDYFSFNVKGLKNVVFNLADIFILLGSIILLLGSFFGKSKLD